MTSDNCLIVTNGSSAAGLLKINRAGSDYLTWDDVLHEGPVPLCNSLAELSAIRSIFLRQRYPNPSDAPDDVFAKRDALIADHRRFERIELWFEHDLYDQLQLIQILDHLADETLPSGKLKLIQADDYLGAQTPDNIMRFRDGAVAVAQAHLATAKTAWAAFRQPTPDKWLDLLEQDLSALPWLDAVVRRMLEELPDSQYGLSRTELEFLQVIARGWDRAARCVGEYLATQPEPKFLGDWTLFNLLTEFMSARDPLIEPIEGHWASDDDAERQRFWKSPVRMTSFGQELLDGKADRIAANGIDRWWGGTHLTTDACWRWNSDTQALAAP